jgi:hypothetical protein
MTSIYDDYYHQAFDLKNHFHDTVDDHEHPQAINLKREIDELTEDFKSEKNPHHLDDRLKTIDHELLQAQTNPQPIMSYQNIEDLKHRFRRLRDGVRKLPNY